MTIHHYSTFMEIKEVQRMLATKYGKQMSDSKTISACCSADILMECSHCHLGCWPVSEPRDHRSPEERAVVDKALAWLEWVDQLQKLSDAEVDLVNATAALRHRRLKKREAK